MLKRLRLAKSGPYRWPYGSQNDYNFEQQGNGSMGMFKGTWPERRGSITNGLRPTILSLFVRRISTTCTGALKAYLFKRSLERNNEVLNAYCGT